MKTGRVLWGVMLSAAFLSCGRAKPGFCPPATPAAVPLAAIDTLMGQQPDSALSLLLAFSQAHDTERLAPYDRHRFHLFLSEALYKNDCGQSNRDAVLKARPYFDSLSEAFPEAPALALLSARAHYMKGVGCYERDSVVEACREYLRALEVMDGRFEEKEMTGERARFMALAFNRLGDLFCDQYMMETAIICYENALRYCLISPTSPIGVSRILNRIGLQYDMLKDFGQAKHYYGQALEQMPGSDNATYRDIQSHVSLCNYDMGLGMEQSIEALRHLFTQADKERERAVYALFMGSIYAEEMVYDSAIAYLEPLWECQQEVEAAKYLRVIYDSLGCTEKKDACVRFLADHIQSEGENKAMVSQLGALFQQHINQKQVQQAAQEKRQAVSKTIKWVIPVVVFIAAGLIVAMRHRHKRRIEAVRQAHQAKQNALSGRLKRSNQELRELKSQVGQQESTAIPQPQAASFADEAVCSLIMERVNEGQFKAQMDCKMYKNYALDKEQVMALHEAANRHFKQFTGRIAHAYPALTRGDLDYCCLYLLGLTDADVSALMQKAYPTVSQRSRKIKAILGSETTLPDALRGFANDNL